MGMAQKTGMDRSAGDPDVWNAVRKDTQRSGKASIENAF